MTSSTNPDPWTQFLDVELGFGKRWHSTGHLDIRPFRKPTTIWSPLSSSSSHPRYIHSNWPVQYLRHYCRRASEQTTLQIFLEKFMADFVEGSPEHIAIPRMRTFLKSAKPIQCLPKSSQRTCAGNSSWMVGPFDPLWAQSGLAAELKAIHLRWSRIFASQGLDGPKQVKISWSLAGLHMGKRVKSVSRPDTCPNGTYARMS